MKKFFMLFCSVFIMLQLANAQAVVVGSENFDGNTHTFASAPGTAWSTSNPMSLALSGTKSIWAEVPFGTGDSVMLTSPVYDCTNYGYITLRFSHICKVSPSDEVRVEYRLNNVGAPWQALPVTAYQGNAANYGTTGFNAASYSIWDAEDSLTIPANTWWKEEIFDLSNSVSYSEVQFRFVIKKGNAIGSQISYGWLIDNFELMGSIYELKAPELAFISAFTDTVLNTGPYVIKAKVAKRTAIGLETPVFTYTATHPSTATVTDTVLMTAYEGDSLWQAVIPQYIFGTTISYSVYGYDTVGNYATIREAFISKHPISGTANDSLQIGVPVSGTYNCAFPWSTLGDGFQWSQMLYMADSIGNAFQSKTLSGIAYWNQYTYNHVRYNVKCYMAETTLTDVTATYIDPLASNAQLVYDGDLNIAGAWNPVMFDQVFTINPGKNLLVWWVDSSSANSCSQNTGTIYWARCSTSYVSSAYNSKYSGCNGTVSNTTTPCLPVTLFYYGAPIMDSNSVALYRINNPISTGIMGGELQPVQVTIKNKGFANLTSAVLGWELNGVLQDTIHWTGSLPDDFNDTITIGYYTQRLNNFDTIRVWVGEPNNITDTNTFDDTLSVISYGCDAQISGTYTIGANEKFKTIKEFIDIAKLCNPVGDVLLEVESGVYAENWDLSSIGKIMGKYNLTITSQAYNADSVIVRPASGVALTLGSNENVMIKNITFDGSALTNYTVQITNSCNNVTIRDCKILASVTTTTSTSAAIYKSSTGTVNNFRIINNYISGGYYGIYLYGGTGTTAYSSGVVIDSNTIIDQYYYATYFYYLGFNSISHNTILSRTSNTSTYWYGLRFYYSEGGVINANKVLQRSTAITMPYGLYVYYTNDARYGTKSGNMGLICNNEINMYTSGSYYGAYVCYSMLKIYNNSILVRCATGTGRGIYFGNYANSYYDVQGNNIVTEGTSSTPIYFSAAPTGTYYNFGSNNLYAPTYIAYTGGNVSGISAWRSSFPYDLTTVSVKPSFVDSTIDLQLSDYTPFAMKRITDVIYDINDSARAFTTAMGCYKGFSPRNTDAILNGMSELQSGAVVNTTDSVKVELLNGGINTLTAATINWSINGVNQVPYTWTGNLTNEQSQWITIGTITYVNKQNIVKVWISAIGTLTDEDLNNDTIESSSYACTSTLAGTYTVGTASSDYPTIEEAVDALTYCGLSGNVTMQMAAGNYNGMTFSNVDFNFPVTFTSATGNANDVKFMTAADALTLNNVSNMRFTNVTFDASAGNGSAVKMMGQITNVDIKNCKLIANPTATGNTSAGIYYNNGSTSSTTTLTNINITNNEISGGYASIYMYYMSGATSNLSGGTCYVTVDSNTMTNFYYAGVYSYYYSRYKSFTHNTMIGRTTATTQYGFYMYYYNVIDTMMYNKMTIYGSSTRYGIYAYYINSSSYAAFPCYFANNEIRSLGAAGTNYGMYIYYPRIKMYNNSIYATGNTTCYGVYHYVTSTSYSLDMRNNMIAIGNTGYPVYCSSATYVTSNYITEDYNNYYSPNGNLAYYGTAKTSLSNLQASTGQDAHSVNVQPSWADTTTNLDLTDYAPFISDNIGNVPDDINGTVRANKTTMGAYTVELNPNNDIALDAIAGFPESGELCSPDYADIDLVITGKGLPTTHFDTDTLTAHVSITGPTTIDTTFYITSDSVTIFGTKTIPVFTNLFVGTAGVYHVDAWIACGIDTNYVNDSLSFDYTANRASLPMDENFANGLPQMMRVADNNTDAAWEVVYDSLNGVIPATGNAMIAFDGTRGAMSRIFTRQLDFSGTSQPVLEFWYYHDTAATAGMNDYTDVRLTFDGGVTFTTLFSVRKNNGTDMGWTQYSYPLDSFVNQSCVILVFEAMRMSMPTFDGIQYIDRIKLTSNQDLAVSAIHTSELSACDYTGKELQVVLGSLTGQNIDFSKYPTTLNVTVSGAATANYNVALNSGMVEALDYDTIVVDNNFNFNPGTYTVKAWVSSIDKITANDTLTETLTVNPDLNVDAQQVTGGNDATNCIGVGSRVNQVVTITNTGNMNMENLELTMNIYDINGVLMTTYTDTIAGVIAVGDSVVKTFTDAYTVPAEEMYTVEVIANPACNANLTFDKVITECVDLSDIEVAAILAPVDGVAQGEDTKVTVRVANNHPNEDAQGVVLHVIVANADGSEIANWTETMNDINAGEYIDYEFPQSFTVPVADNFTITAFVNNVDTKIENDTLTATIATNVAVNEADANGMSLSQNVPNPANSQAAVSYSIPEDGSVVFTILTVTGQVLHTQTVEALAGKNSIEFNTENLAAGVYFYTMDFQGQRLMKKMVIKK